MTATYQAKQEELLKAVYDLCKDEELSLDQIRDRLMEKRPDFGDVSLSEIEMLYVLLDRSGLVKHLVYDHA